MAVAATADIAPLRAVVHTIEAEGPSSVAEVAVDSCYLALYERDPAAPARALAKISSENLGFRYHSRTPGMKAWWLNCDKTRLPHMPPSWALGLKPRNLSLLNREMRNL
jgi:hypothetical protein